MFNAIEVNKRIMRTIRQIVIFVVRGFAVSYEEVGSI